MLRTTALLLLCLATALSHAGTACTEKAPTPETIQKAVDLGLKTRNALEESGAGIALIGRIGSDLSEYGLRYSHAGIVWRDHPSGKWLVVHLLNKCGTANSDLFDEGLGNFFLDDPLVYEALLIIPGMQVQQQLVQTLKSDLPQRLYEPRYSMIANPWSTRYQNSNQWLLETVAVSLSEGATTRARAQDWLQAHGYEPSKINLPPLKRLGARLFAVNTRFDDHTNEEWSSSRYNIVSVESIKRFIERADPNVRISVIHL